MCKWRILFILTQEAQPKIIDSVTHFRLRILCENIYQSCMRIQNGRIYSSSHVYPKTSFVLGSFRASSHSAYFGPLSRRCRISCFPVFMLVRFYVNSSKKPNTSISFTVAFSNIFHDNFVVFIFGNLWIYFLEPSGESCTKEETIQMYTNEFGF